jgi:hypothetical protein
VFEAVEILSALGATTIEVESTNGWEQEVGANASIPIPAEIPAKVGFDWRRTRSKTSTIKLAAALAPRPANRELPAGLSWYAQQQDWQGLVNLRQQGKAESFTLEVSYEDDFEVTGGIEATAAEVGLKLGGRFRAYEHTVWHLHGKWSAEHPVEPAFASR